MNPDTAKKLAEMGDVKANAAKLRVALEEAKKNPNDPRSVELRRRLERGMFNVELQSLGKKPFPVQVPKIDMAKAMAGVTAGEQSKPPAPGRASETFGDIKETFGAVGTSLRKGFEQAGQMVRDENLSPVQRVVGPVISAASGAANAVGDVAIGAGKAVLPQETEDMVKQFAESIGEQVSESEAARKVADWYDSLPPQQQANLKMFGGIANIVSTVLGFQGAKATGRGVQAGMEAAGPVVREGVETAGDVLKAGARKVDDVFAKRAVATQQARMDAVVDLISPKVTGKAGDDLIASGSVTIDEPTMFGKARANFSKDPESLRLANTVSDIVDPSKSVSTNLNLVKNAITDVAQNNVAPFLKENPVPFNFEDLQNRLRLVQPVGSLKDDVQAFKTYNRVREEVLDDMAGFLKKSGNVDNLTDMNELWNARKVLDDKIERELGATALNSPQYTGVKVAARDIRTEINKFIIDSLSNPGQAEQLNKFYEFLNVARSRGIKISSQEDAYKLLRQQMGVQDIPEDIAKGAYFKFQLDQMSNMYDVVDNLKRKARTELGKSKIDLFVENNPKKVKIGAATAAAVGGGAAYGLLTGQ